MCQHRGAPAKGPGLPPCPSSPCSGGLSPSKPLPAGSGAQPQPADPLASHPPRSSAANAAGDSLMSPALLTSGPGLSPPGFPCSLHASLSPQTFGVPSPRAKCRRSNTRRRRDWLPAPPRSPLEPQLHRVPHGWKSPRLRVRKEVRKASSGGEQLPFLLALGNQTGCPL